MILTCPHCGEAVIIKTYPPATAAETSIVEVEALCKATATEG